MSAPYVPGLRRARERQPRGARSTRDIDPVSAQTRDAAAEHEMPAQPRMQECREPTIGVLPLLSSEARGRCRIAANAGAEPAAHRDSDQVPKGVAIDGLRLTA